MISTETNDRVETDAFFREYTSQDAILKYTRATAGFGISYLLDHDYKTVYLEALGQLPPEVRRRGLRVLEFGCGGGMNLLHLVSVLSRDGFNVASAIGADFSPVLIQAANKEAESYLGPRERSQVQFCVAKNETLLEDLSAGLGQELSKLENSFQMNDRFPAFRSALKNKLRDKKEQEEECYLPSLEDYTAPFQQAGFEVSRSEHFCWIPHSAGRFMTRLLHSLSPILSTVAGSRAMRSLVVAKKPLHP